MKHSLLKEARDDLDRRLITQALKRHLGNITYAAIDLGISRPAFYEIMTKLGISYTGRRGRPKKTTR